MRNLEQLYGKTEQINEYYNDKEYMQKRDETKAELKQLLKKYVKQPSHNVLCSQLVKDAQRENHNLQRKRDKRTQQIASKSKQFEKTKPSVLDCG